MDNIQAASLTVILIVLAYMTALISQQPETQCQLSVNLENQTNMIKQYNITDKHLCQQLKNTLNETTCKNTSKGIHCGQWKDIKTEV